MDKTRMDRALQMETMLTDRHRRGLQELNMLAEVMKNDPRVIEAHLRELKIEFSQLREMEREPIV